MANEIQFGLAQLYGLGMLNQDDRWEKVMINHIPVMITENEKILCIPNREETTHIGISAMTGKGKGILGNNLLGWLHWLIGEMCMVLSDFQRETFEFSLPCINKAFINNNLIINSNPIPLPMVYVYPSNKELIISDEEKLFPHIKMSMPTRAVIRNIGQFYQLDKAAKYVTGYIDRFVECTSLKEIDETISDILNEAFQGENRKSFEDMKFKINTIFKNIFEEEISDSAHTDAPAFLTINKKGLKGYTNLVIQSLFASMLIPSIQTGVIRNNPWFSAYMAFIVETIYEDMMFKDEYFKDKNLVMYVPEIDKLWKGVENGHLIKQALSLIGTNGRMARIRMIWDTQDYDSVPISIRSNTKHLFLLRKSNAEEVKGIKKDFNVDSEVQNWILSLETKPEQGRFDCVALTIDGFVLYNLRNGDVTTTSSPQRGRLITPLAEHRAPGRSLRRLIRS